MTFREYIVAIESTKLFYGGKARIVKDIFSHAGYVNEISDHTINSWIAENANKYRQCKIRDYFPDEVMNDEGFVSFFSRRAHKLWPKLQDAFRPMEADDECVIQLNTEQPDLFYWSVLNQFQAIHKLPLSEEPIGAMRTRFMQAIPDNCIEKIIAPQDEESFTRIMAFLKRIKTDIIMPFQLKHNESFMYQNIKAFYNILKEYAVNSTPAVNSLFSAFCSHEQYNLQLLQQLNDLYDEISGIKPLEDADTIVTIGPPLFSFMEE